MTALESLIQAKKQAQTEDLLRFLDEIVLYKKLSKAEAFRDLRTSEAARKRLPLLSGAHTGNLYSLAMLSMVQNIMQHLDEEIPDVLYTPLENITERDEKRIALLEKSIIRVNYYPLSSYQDADCRDKIVAVFENKQSKSKTQNALLIVTRVGDRYDIYQGYYAKKEVEAPKLQHIPYTHKEGEIALRIEIYSMLGNNAYPFAELSWGTDTFSVMMPDYKTIWLLKPHGLAPSHVLPLTAEQVNGLNMAKTEVPGFATKIVEIIKGGLMDETVEGSTPVSIENN